VCLVLNLGEGHPQPKPAFCPTCHRPRRSTERDDLSPGGCRCFGLVHSLVWLLVCAIRLSLLACSAFSIRPHFVFIRRVHRVACRAAVPAIWTVSQKEWNGFCACLCKNLLSHAARSLRLHSLFRRFVRSAPTLQGGNVATSRRQITGITSTFV
jgi:hypothetical protein